MKKKLLDLYSCLCVAMLSINVIYPSSKNHFSPSHRQIDKYFLKGRGGYVYIERGWSKEKKREYIQKCLRQFEFQFGVLLIPCHTKTVEFSFNYQGN